jgi:tetratricopeptide (TPR) repeat protein
MRQVRRKMQNIDPGTLVAQNRDAYSMLIRSSSLLALLCLMAVGPLASAAQTFGLDDGQAVPTAYSQTEWVQQAQVLERSRDWAGLLDWGQAWAQADALNPLAWFVQGRALNQMGRLPEAIAAYQQNLRLAPDDVLARNNLGNVYRDSGRPREAMEAYRAAVEIDPDYVQAWHNLGLTFYLTKGQAGVVQALQKLQATDPALAEVWRKLAIDYSITRDKRVAREAVRVLRGLSAAERARMFGILFADG